MKHYRIHSVCIAAVLCLHSTTSAQQPHPKPPSPAERLDKMTADLNLSETQVQKLKPILEANMEKMRAIREDASLTEEQKREKSHGIRKEGGDAIMAVLTPEQKTKFEDELKKHPKGGAGGGPRNGPPPGGGAAGRPGPKGTPSQ